MNNSLELRQIGRYYSGIFDEGAAEITAYDAGSQQLFVINSANSTIDFDSEDIIGIAGLGISFEDLNLTQQQGNTLISSGENNLNVLSMQYYFRQLDLEYVVNQRDRTLDRKYKTFPMPFESFRI